MRSNRSLLLIPLLCAVCSPPEPTDPQQAPNDTAKASGVTSVTVTEGTNLSFSLSPDGSQIALSLQGVLFTLPASGGEATAMSDYYQDVREPVWSPDAATIAYYGYANGNWDLWTMPAAGGTPTPLTDDPFDDREPQYSPDGTHIAFSSDRGGNYDIWLLRVSDRTVRQVTQTPVNEHSPSWSPDGAAIAFVVSTNAASSEIHSAELAGGASRLVTTEPGAVSGLRWQPDGLSLSYQLAAAGSTQLKSIRTEGDGSRSLSREDDDVFPFKAAWGEDGALFYAANGRIYRQVADGERREIPFTATFDLRRQPYERRRRNYDDASPRPVLGISQPALSDDGERVCFAALGDLWLWHPGENQLTNITESPFAESSAQWSPDGTRIAYISDRPRAEGGTTDKGLWVYHVERDEHSPVVAAKSGVSNPSWSPDGRSIAFFARIPGNALGAQLMVTELQDGTVTPIGIPTPSQTISWSRDGGYVASTVLAPYSSRYREGVYKLVVTSVDGKERREIQPIAHRNMTDAVLTPAGQAMSYVQDGRLWRQVLSETFEPRGDAAPMTEGLADTPSWSAAGRYLVYMNADRMMKLNAESGETTDITPTLTWRPDKPDSRWTLFVGRLYDGVGDDYIENALITIDGNRIAAIEPGATGEAADVDATGRAAYPGLFEMHAHMGATSERQGRAWLAYGVTSVRDPGAHPYVAKERQEMWASGRSIGPRTYTTGFLADGNRVFYSIAEGITSDEHLERALHRAERLELDFIKTYVRLPDGWQKRVVEFAHGLGIPTSSHELFPAVAHGMDHVEHIGGTSRRGFRPKVSGMGRSYNDVVRLLAESGMGITPTVVLPGYSVIVATQPDYLSTPQFEAFYGTTARQMAERLAQAGARAAATAEANGQLLRDLAAADALMVTGTDAPFVPYGAGLHAELRLYALAGLSPRQILRAATVKSARAAGVDDDLGSLEAGKLADIVIVDGDPLRDIADADNVTMTIKNGRVYPLEELLQTPSWN